MICKSFRTSLLVGVAVSGIGVTVPAFAQGTDDSSASGDIIVTARRVEERLQDVPISITVYSQEDLNKRNIAVATDLATYTPSLAVNQRYGPEKASFAIRGFNQDQSTAPTVGVYFAEVVGVRAQGGTTSGNTVGAGAFTDLQNVQVLKGPQGTLFGRNTTGGAVLLTPTKPTDKLEGYVEGTYGNFDQKRVQAALNIPLADTFKVRLSVDRNKRDGYMKNVSGIGAKAYNDVDYFYGRLSIVADLTPDLENYTIFHYSESDTNGYGMRIETCDRKPIDFTDPTGLRVPGNPKFSATRAVFATAACAQIDRRVARGDSRRTVDINNPDPYVNLMTWQAINTTTWKASDTLTVKNIMSYGEITEKARYQLNGDNFTVPALPFPLDTAFPNIGAPLQTVQLDVGETGKATNQSSFTEELQLQGESADGRFNFVAGGYLEFSRPMSWDTGRTSVFGYCDPPSKLACSLPLGFAIVSASKTRFKFDNHGIFAQATYNLTDRLALTGGIRYTFDKIVGRGESTRFTFAPIPGLGTRIVSEVCNDVVRHSGVDISDPVILNIPNVGPTKVAGGDGSHDSSKCRTDLVNKSNKPTWLINLDYKPSQDLLVYAKYARGYRQGGMVFTNPGLELFDPEKVDNYEIGAKTSFRGAVSGFFNIAAFYNNFSNQQVILQSIAKPNSGLVGGNVIGNAGKTEIYGAEVDALARIRGGFSLSAGYTYLHTKVKEFNVPIITDPNSPFSELRPTTDVGQPLTQSPKHRLTATATYTLPLDESIGELSVGATYTYTSSQAFDFDPLSIGRIGSTKLLNLNLDWKRVGGSDFDLAGFVTNVTNETYPIAVGLGYTSLGYENYVYNPPRMYGVRVKYSFGQ